MRTDCLVARLVGQKPNVHSALPHHRAQTMEPQYEGEGQFILPARDPADMPHRGVFHYIDERRRPRLGRPAAGGVQCLRSSRVKPYR
jgi:hypothetical protein